MAFNTQNYVSTLDLVLPEQNRSFMKSVLIALTASLFIAIMAQIQIPWYPVPLTMQPFAVVFLGLLFPWRIALGAVAAYIAMAASGLPVLTGFKAGLMWPSSGYIFGYLPAVVAVSYLNQNWAFRNLIKRCFAVIAGYAIIFASGVTVLTQFVGLETAIQTGLMPFLFGDLVVKNLLAVILSMQIHKKLKSKLSA